MVIVRAMMVLCAIGLFSGCLDKRHARKNNTNSSYLKKCTTGESVNGSGYQKEIDIDNVELDYVTFDYVWTVDIPVPMDAVQKRNYCQAEPDLYAIGYTSVEHQDDLIAFYLQQMELLGWQCWWQTQGLEALLMFEKPHKQCAISIRPGSSRKKTDIVVMQKTT